MAKDNALAGPTLSATFATLSALWFLFIAWGVLVEGAAGQGAGMGVHLSLRVRHVKLEGISTEPDGEQGTEYQPSSSGSHTGRGQLHWGNPGVAN